MTPERTRIPRDRTASEIEIEIEIDLVDAAPLYQRIAEEAKALHESGMSIEAVGRALGVSGQTVAKGINWLRTQKGTVNVQKGQI